jgi:hypothetical protein
MKKFLSILLSIAVLLCCAVPFCADTVYRCGDWTLGVVSGAEDYSFSIRSYDGEDAVVTAPADYGGYPIIRIDGYAFATNTKVQEVILSDTITSIGAGAFSQCGNLTRIVIPDAVTQIADDAFQNCDQVVIYAPADSDAITYAIEHNIAYVVIGALTYVLGDADGNGDIECVDATIIQRYIAQIETPYTKTELMRGDVDGSGDLEIFDVTCIQCYLANMKTQFPIGTRIE